MKTRQLLLYTFGGIILSGCVDEYRLPKDIDDLYKQELVIEGSILPNSESVFYVTRTIPLNSTQERDNIVNAEIAIVGQNGYESETAEFIEDAKYIIKTEKLSNNTLYAVRVIVDGETYQSSFQSLLDSPDIDSISWKEQQESISIHVSTHNDNKVTRCYMWTYEEDWEFHAEIDITDGSNQPFIFNSEMYPMKDNKNLYYYCWGHQNSSMFYIYNTEDLKENTVKEKELLDIKMNDIRISYIYSILVKQWSITSEAYEYYRLMKLYTEESNGIFTPMPSDVRGNLTCISNPQNSVRGFITASNVKEKRLFVYSSDFKLNHSEYENCEWQFPDKDNPQWKQNWESLIDNMGYVALSESTELDENSILFSKECADCRKTKGASKQRPDFWPNNHE